MKVKIFIASVLFFTVGLKSFVCYSQITPPGFHQLLGGSEINIKHRPDLADSAYQVFIRLNKICHNCGGAGYNPTPPNYLSLTDSCAFRNNNLNYFYFGNVNVLNNNPLFYANPYTGTNPSQYIFKTCQPNYPPVVFTNSAEYNIAQPIADTFALLREYWYDTIVYLPEKCGMWQAVNYGGLVNGNVHHSPLGNPRASMGTNIDWTNVNNNPGASLISYEQRGLAQINTAVSNSNPYFLSYPTAIFYRGIPSVYKQNGIDPDGDSLVYSSIHLVYHDTVHHHQPQSFWEPFIWQNQISNGNVPPYNPPVDSAQSGLRKIPGYACIPGTGTLPSCLRYDPVYNPFDTDSTFHINPSTGEVTFTAQSPNQFVHLLLRCDEYRNGVWVGAVSRRVNFFIFDSTYYTLPNFYIDSSNLVNCFMDTPYVFYACKNQVLTIPFVTKSPLSTSFLNVKDNHGLSIPTSLLTYQNNSTDSVRGTLQWTPGNADTGWHHVLVTVSDSSCNISPYIREYSYLLRIYVSNGMQVQASDTTICAGSSIQLQASGLGNNISWSQLSGTPNSLSCTQCANPWVSPMATSVYVASASTSGLSCVSQDTVTVKVINDFTLNATDTTVCFKNGFMVKANASGPNSALQYQWSPATGVLGGTTNSFIMILPSTINYYVTATDSLGCFTHTDTASIVYDSTFIPSYTLDKSKICSGDTVNINIYGGTNELWSPNYNLSTTSGNSVQAWPDTSVTYVVTLENTNLTCKTDLNVNVDVIALRADAGPDYEIYDGELVYLGGPNMLCGPGCNLMWYPDKWLFFNFQQNPKAVPHVNTTYWVVLSTEDGSCVDRDSVTVRVKCTDIYIPNAFNPESRDNEYTKFFGPRNVSLDMEYFRIFNRWGEMVFESRDVGYRWDGKYKGVPQPVGNYVWVIKAKCPDGQYMEKKGNVLLVR